MPPVVSSFGEVAEPRSPRPFEARGDGLPFSIPRWSAILPAAGFTPTRRYLQRSKSPTKPDRWQRRVEGEIAEESELTIKSAGGWRTRALRGPRSRLGDSQSGSWSTPFTTPLSLLAPEVACARFKPLPSEPAPVFESELALRRGYSHRCENSRVEFSRQLWPWWPPIAASG